jgi:hypothetical protein
MLAALLIGFALLVLLAGYAMTFMRDEVRAAASLLTLWAVAFPALVMMLHVLSWAPVWVHTAAVFSAPPFLKVSIRLS